MEELKYTSNQTIFPITILEDLRDIIPRIHLKSGIFLLSKLNIGNDNKKAIIASIFLDNLLVCIKDSEISSCYLSTDALYAFSFTLFDYLKSKSLVISTSSNYELIFIS